MTEPSPQREPTPVSAGPESMPDAARGDAASGDAASPPGQGIEAGPPSGTDAHAGARNVQYKGAPLEAERGPGLGCFWTQVVVLAIAVIITPLSVVWGWPEWVSAALLFLVVLLLLFTGQTVIFLLRLVAADRRAAGRRRPLASATKTVGELEDERGDGGSTAGNATSDDGAPDGRGPVRQ